MRMCVCLSKSICVQIKVGFKIKVRSDGIVWRCLNHLTVVEIVIKLGVEYVIKRSDISLRFAVCFHSWPGEGRGEYRERYCTQTRPAGDVIVVT